MDVALRRNLPNVTSRRRWTRDEYEHLIEIGMIGEDEPVELIGGEIVAKMSPQKSRHSFGVRAAEYELGTAYETGFDVRCQLPLALNDDSEPEPDVAVVVGSFRTYVHQQPTTAVLVVEVSDTTLLTDRYEKASLYASAGIPEYWIVNLRDREVEVHRNPVPATDAPFGTVYAMVERKSDSETLNPPRTEASIKVVDLLP